MAKPKAAGEELERLKRQIKNKEAGRLYFFFGEETFLLEYYLGQMKKLLLEELTESFNFHRFTGETFDLTEFGEAVENLPMMAEHTLVQVDDIDPFRMNESDRDRMGAILSDIPDYCTVIFVYGGQGWKPDQRMKKLWEAVKKAGMLVDFAKQDQRHLIDWLTRRFAAKGKKITAELCVYLIDITDGTMTSLLGEVEKICAYSGADTICQGDIDAVTEPVLDAMVFQMTDLMSAGKYDQALVKLQQLLKMQQEPVLILGAIGAHFRRLGTARTLLDNRRTSSELQKLCNLSDYPARKTMEAARGFSAPFCKKAAELILETDYRLKTSYDDSQRLLELLVLELAREASHG